MILYYLGVIWRVFLTSYVKHFYVVLVTGSGTGIGRELALHFARHQCRLVLWNNAQETNDETAELCRSLGAEAVAYTVNVADRALVYKTADEVRQQFGHVDIVVNNAGVGYPLKQFFKMEDELHDRVIDVNLKSVIWMAKAFLPPMIEKRSGHFVSIGSMLSHLTCPVDSSTDYSGSKFGVWGVMEVLEHSLWFRRIYDVKFTTCFPTFVRTAFIDDMPSVFALRYVVHALFRDFGGFPVISANDCAQQITQGIELERRFVFIPGRQAWIFFFKGMLPWNLYSKVVLGGFKACPF
ncbi:hydroxysteroid (17-beta) dehydrogenase 13 [Aphelenchoides avenae]|nr:hydroxysteroid (17-beta) dehydrogenase 13 [Aphelenchus avenae]